MDYSPYYYNYDGKKPNGKKRPFAPFNPKAHVKQNIGSILLILVIISSLITTLVLIGKFSGKDIIGEVSLKLSSEKVLKYYLVTLKPTQDKNEATVNATKVRLSGGAGYVYKENEYIVVLACFSDKQSAEAVQDKNEGTEVRELKLNKKELLNSTGDDKITKKTVESIENTLNLLENNVALLAQNETMESDVLIALNDERNTLLTLKEEIINSNPSNKEQLLNMLDPTYGALDAITQVSTHTNLVAELRYIFAQGIVAFVK